MPHRIEISGRYHDKQLRVHRKLPSSWNECTAEEFQAVCHVLASDTDPERHPEMILFRWLNLPSHLYFNLDPFYIEKLIEKLAFLWEKNDLSKVLLPSFVHKGVTYLGPSDAFINVSLIEWVAGERFLKKYNQTKSEIDLNNLVYCMYRPVQPGLTTSSPEYLGDLREDLNDFTLEEKAKAFSDLPREIKMSALITMIGNRNIVIQRFSAVFDDAEKKGVTDQYGWAGILVEETGGKWGSEIEVMQANVYKVFISWHKNILRLEEYEQRMEEINSK